MEFSSSKLEQPSYISGGRFEKQTKNLLKVVSYDVFSIVTTLKHRKSPCEVNVM